MLFELREVTLSRGGRRVLDAVSAGIPAGATAILGPSGSGKSTLLRLLNRLADPDGGEILYRGRPLTAYDPLALRREVALVPQLPALLPGTVESNLRYAATLAARAPHAGRGPHAGRAPHAGRGPDGGRVPDGGREPDAGRGPDGGCVPDGGREPDLARALRLAGLGSGFAARDVARLSVGEQQRAMLARALAQEPRVLLLDEPTSALDHAARDAIEAALAELRRELEISLVIVTHDPEQARRLGDWVVRIESGRVAGSGALAEVLA